MTDTAYHVDPEDDRPAFWTYDAERAEMYSLDGHRVKAVTGERPHTADL